MGGLKSDDERALNLKAVANIWVGSKASWCEVPEGIPTFDEAPTPEFLQSLSLVEV